MSSSADLQSVGLGTPDELLELADRISAMLMSGVFDIEEQRGEEDDLRGEDNAKEATRRRPTITAKPSGCVEEPSVTTVSSDVLGLDEWKYRPLKGQTVYCRQTEALHAVYTRYVKARELLLHQTMGNNANDERAVDQCRESEVWMRALIEAVDERLRAEALPSRRRRNLSPKATQILQAWYGDHQDHPYATDEEKELLASQTELSVEQVSTWLSNRRNRRRAD